MSRKTDPPSSGSRKPSLPPNGSYRRHTWRNRDLETAVGRLEFISELGRLLHRGSDLDALLRQIARRVRTFFKALGVFINLLDEERMIWSNVHWDHASPEWFDLVREKTGLDLTAPELPVPDTVEVRRLRRTNEPMFVDYPTLLRTFNDDLPEKTLRQLTRTFGIRQVGLFPMRVRTATLGHCTITVDRELNSEEKLLLHTVFQDVAHAVLRHRYLKETENQIKILARLNELKTAIIKITDRREMCEMLCRSLSDVMPNTITALFVYEDRRSALNLSALCCGEGNECDHPLRDGFGQLMGHDIPLDPDGELLRTMTSGELTWLDGLAVLARPEERDTPQVARFRNLCRTPLDDQVLAGPLNSSGRPLGLVLMLTDSRGSRHTLEVLRAHTLEAALALDKLRVFSESRQIQEQLFHSQKMESLGRLAAGTAHELNNALTPPMGFTEILSDCKELEPRHRRMIRRLHAGIHRSQEIVAGLLNFTRSEPEEHTSGTLDTDVTAVLEMYSGHLRSHGIELQFRKGQPDNFMAAHGKLQQVMANLLLNAVDAMSESPKKLLAVATGEWIRNGNRCAVLEVTDSGCGMSEEQLARVFEPFYTTKEMGRGSGLGLSICYSIVSLQHGGEILLDSRPGHGSTFTVLLPKATANET